MLNGSPRYLQNPIRRIGTAAWLARIGLDAMTRLAMTGPSRGRPRAAVAMLAFAGFASWSYASLEGRARAIVLPDWGDVVQSLNGEKITVGPRWFCLCLANHWQIHWNQAGCNHEAFLEVPDGGTIEVVLGAQLSEDHQPTVFGQDPVQDRIRETPLPAYLASVQATDVRSGVVLRRWMGTRVSRERAAGQTASAPVLLLPLVRQTISAAGWRQFLTVGETAGCGVVTFKEVPVPEGMIHAMIAPSGGLATIVVSMERDLGISTDDIHFFTLTPLSR